MFIKRSEPQRRSSVVRPLYLNWNRFLSHCGCGKVMNDVIVIQRRDNFTLNSPREENAASEVKGGRFITGEAGSVAAVVTWTSSVVELLQLLPASFLRHTSRLINAQNLEKNKINEIRKSQGWKNMKGWCSSLLSLCVNPRDEFGLQHPRVTRPPWWYLKGCK